MIADCPNRECRSSLDKNVIYFNDGSDNIENLPHYHLECQQCGQQFNHWGVGIERLREVFRGEFFTYK